MNFRERRQRQETLARLRDVDSVELAQIVVAPDHLDHDVACEVLLERFRPAMVKHAKRVCRQLGHYGGSCPGYRCEHAFSSAMSDFATRLTGGRYSFASLGGGAVREFYRNANDRARRTKSPTSVASRWLKRRASDPLRTLPTAVASELRAPGRATDVRRRWNVDRGLLSRANMPASLKSKAGADLMQRCKQHENRGAKALIALASPVHDVQKWSDQLYHDACDVAPPIVERHDDHRIARSVGWHLVDDHTTVDMRQAIELVIDVLISADDGDFWLRHMGAAYHHTRQHHSYGTDPQHEPDRERWS